MKHLFCSLLCVISCLTSAQSVVVRDKSSLQPIENVEITASADASPIRFTDRLGRAELSTLPDSGRLVFRRVGYQMAAYTVAQLRSINFTVLLAEKQLDLNEVVVAANRTAEPLTRVAQSIRVVTRNELQFLNQPTMAEVLQQSGHVLVQKSQLGGGSPILGDLKPTRY